MVSPLPMKTIPLFVAHRQGTTPFGCPVHLGDDDAIDVDCLMEPPCLFACLLTECCIDNQPAVGCFCQDIKFDDLLDEVFFQGMSALRIDDDKLEILELASPSRVILTASFSFGFPKQGTLTWAHRVEIRSKAPRRKVSAQITPTFNPFFWKYRASFAVVVVLPLPCRPAIRMVWGSSFTSADAHTSRTSSW